MKPPFSCYDCSSDDRVTISIGKGATWPSWLEFWSLQWRKNMKLPKPMWMMALVDKTLLFMPFLLIVLAITYPYKKKSRNCFTILYTRIQRQTSLYSCVWQRRNQLMCTYECPMIFVDTVEAFPLAQDFCAGVKNWILIWKVSLG